MGHSLSSVSADTTLDPHQLMSSNVRVINQLHDMKRRIITNEGSVLSGKYLGFAVGVISYILDKKVPPALAAGQSVE